MKPRRLSKRYGIWANPWMRPKSWDDAAAKLAIEITAAEVKRRKAAKAAKKKPPLSRGG